MKQAVVFLRGIKAGILTEDENGYTFEYNADYLASADAEAVSLTLPLGDKPYRDKVLFPFFDGLISINAKPVNDANKNMSRTSARRGTANSFW